MSLNSIESIIAFASETGSGGPNPDLSSSGSGSDSGLGGGTIAAIAVCAVVLLAGLFLVLSRWRKFNHAVGPLLPTSTINRPEDIPRDHPVVQVQDPVEHQDPVIEIIILPTEPNNPPVEATLPILPPPPPVLPSKPAPAQPLRKRPDTWAYQLKTADAPPLVSPAPRRQGQDPQIVPRGPEYIPPPESSSSGKDSLSVNTDGVHQAHFRDLHTTSPTSPYPHWSNSLNNHLDPPLGFPFNHPKRTGSSTPPNALLANAALGNRISVAPQIDISIPGSPAFETFSLN
ncbi:hypothetical protein MVEG_10343 [Podila verticillata NRRL 6337]|nr:hypothetical protein MVEG_10343 [Podila verticillata NRRL 6337]